MTVWSVLTVLGTDPMRVLPLTRALFALTRLARAMPTNAGAVMDMASSVHSAAEIGSSSLPSGIAEIHFANLSDALSAAKAITSIPQKSMRPLNVGSGGTSLMPPKPN
jgi:hypothetical protein